MKTRCSGWKRSLTVANQVALGRGSSLSRFSHEQGAAVQLGGGPVPVISANAEQMFLDITPANAA